MGRFHLLCILTLLLVEGNEGKIHRCFPGQTRRVFHLCTGDVIQCTGPDAFGSWNVTKIDHCNGILRQADRQVDLDSRHRWELPCCFRWCKFDFSCRRNPLEDKTATGHLYDGRCYREALEVSPWLQKEGHEPKTRGKRALEDGDSNMFVRVHTELFGEGQFVCYPAMKSISSLFAVSPEWGGSERLVKCQDGKPVPVGTVTLYYDEASAPPANCLPLPSDEERSYPGCEDGVHAANSQGRALPCNFTTSADTRRYGSCFTNQGFGCAVVSIPRNIPCLVRVPHRPNCSRTSDGIRCSTPEECIPIHAGSQLVCGRANGTHLTIGSHHFPIPSAGHSISESWMRWAKGAPATDPHRRCDGAIYTEKGYYFFFNGTATNVLRRPFPNNVAIGALVPTTVPCPTSWSREERRIQRRAVSREFCSNWRNPDPREADKGPDIGWGVLSVLTLGEFAGSGAAGNGNYIVCGLTILGNATTGALEAITTQLSEMALFSLEHRYALDYQLARARGSCAIVNERCMMGIEDGTGDIALPDGMREGVGWGDCGVGSLCHWIISSVAISAAIVVVCGAVGFAIVKCNIARRMGDGETGENIPLQHHSPPPPLLSGTQAVLPGPTEVHLHLQPRLLHPLLQMPADLHR